MDLRGGLLSRFKCLWIWRSENLFSPEMTEGVRIAATVITRASKKLTLLKLTAMVKERKKHRKRKSFWRDREDERFFWEVNNSFVLNLSLKDRTFFLLKQTQVKKLGFFCVRLVTVFSSVLNFYFFLSGSFFLE